MRTRKENIELLMDFFVVVGMFFCTMNGMSECIDCTISRLLALLVCSYFLFDAPKTKRINRHYHRMHSVCCGKWTCEAAATAWKTSCFVDNEQPLNDVIIRSALKIIVFHAAAHALMLSVGQ